MAELSADLLATARKSLTCLLQGVEGVGQAALAEGCGVDAATITRDKAVWDRFARAAAIAGVKFVPSDSRCYMPETIDSILILARQRMAQLDDIKRLEWDEK